MSGLKADGQGSAPTRKQGTSRIRLQGVSHTHCVSPSPQHASPEQRLIIISGEEGAGKSTIVRALLPSTPYGARIDAEDIGQTNPCPMDDIFFDLLRRNVAGLVENFWAAGYVNVIAGSFLRRYSDYVSFRQLLPRPSGWSSSISWSAGRCATAGESPGRSRPPRNGATWSTRSPKIRQSGRQPMLTTGTSALTPPTWTSPAPCSGSKTPSRRSIRLAVPGCAG